MRDDDALRPQALFRIDDVELLLPIEIGRYTDFYSSREHAANVECMMRGAEHALMSNWLRMLIAYLRRASSVVVSGTDIRFGEVTGKLLPGTGALSSTAVQQHAATIVAAN